MARNLVEDILSVQKNAIPNLGWEVPGARNVISGGDIGGGKKIAGKGGTKNRKKDVYD